MRATETLAATGAVTNQFSDSGDPLGFGIEGGYNFAPWGYNVVVGPFASLDYMRQTVNRDFAGGQYLGSTTNLIFTLGAKAGVKAGPDVLIYGLAGASFLNQNLNVNFATTASRNTTTPGFITGLGLEVQPDSWRLAGLPVSLFAQYRHTWWGTANFQTPTSSPLFNYAFQRQDDTIRFGFNVWLQP